MYRTSNTIQKTARAKIKTPYIKNASWLVIISGNKVFGSAELSGVDSGSGVVEFFSGSGAMVDALTVLKRVVLLFVYSWHFLNQKSMYPSKENNEPIRYNSSATIMATKLSQMTETFLNNIKLSLPANSTLRFVSYAQITLWSSWYSKRVVPKECYTN